MEKETQLSRNELKMLFHTGRRLELIACYAPMNAPSPRTVHAQRSYGFDMQREDGRISTMRFESGNKIVAIGDECGIGYTEVKIVDSDGKTAAHYRLL